MKTIITGGTGLIGRALAGSLTRDGHEVILLSRRTPAVPGLAGNVKVVQWDAHTAEGWGHLVNDADAIVNLAGESIAGAGLIPTRWTEERKRLISQSRAGANQAVVQALQLAGDRKPVLIQGSAVGYYGPGGDSLLTEDSPAGNDYLARVCVESERQTQAVEALGVRRVIARTGLVLSAQGGVLSRLMLPFKFYAGGPSGSGAQWYPWIHIDDEVRAIRFLIESPQAAGVYNLSAPNPLRNRDFSRALSRVMGRPAFIPAPAFALKLALGELSTLVLDGQRAVPERLTKLGFKFGFSDAEAALRDLLRR